jgi:IPT/TIG domain
MRRCFVWLLFTTAFCVAVFAFEGFSKLTSVEPDTGKVGDAVSAKGENLEKSKIGELYLTDGKNDVKAAITEQSETEIKFKVPKIAAGRYRLMLLTAKKDSLIEQPVVFTVE